MGVKPHPANMYFDIETFIKHEIELWGFDYIEALLAAGYEAVLTDRGFKWLSPVKSARPVSALAQ